MSPSPEHPLKPPRRIHWGWWVAGVTLLLVAILIILGILWVAMKIYVP